MARKPQEYSDDEFQAVVNMIRNDPEVRADIEAITGQTIDGKTPRELFDLFRALEGATQVQQVVVRYGQARRALRRTRMQVADPVNVPEAVAAYVEKLQREVDEQKAKRKAAEAALRQAHRPTLAAVPGDRKVAG